MSSGETLYTARTPYPSVMGINRVNAVQMAIYRDGDLVAPTEAGSTFSLLSPDGTAVVNAQAITVDADGISTYSIAAALLDPDDTGITLGEGWQEVWSLILGGVPFPFDREAALARRPISPSISDVDLLASYPDLGAMRGSTVDNFQGFIDEAWKRIILRWLSEGGITYKVKSAYAFRTAHIDLTLGLFYRWLGKNQSGRGNYLELSDDHLKSYEREFARINVTEDLDHDGTVDAPDQRSRRGVVLNPNVPPENKPRRPSRGGRW